MNRYSQNLQGALWKTLSCLCFASMNGVVRYLSVSSAQAEAISSAEIAFFQNLFGLFLILPWILKNRPQVWLTEHPTLHLWRVAASALGIVLWYTALAFMPIAQAVALGFLGPIMTTVGARLALGEPLGHQRLIAIALGILGGLLITHSRYFSGEISWLEITPFFLIPLASALAFSVSTLMAKKLTQYDSPQIIVIYLMVFMVPFLLIPTLLNWVTPTPLQLLALLLLGGLAAAAHLAMNKAFVCSDITFLIPFGATRLIASGFIGFLFFSEIPSLWTCIGSLVIMTAIIFLGHLEVFPRRNRGTAVEV